MFPVVNVRNLTKIFRLYSKPIDRLKEIFIKHPLHNEFVALDNISFDISSGESFGIIGDNGAGKSTLLKILARTLSFTFGEVSIHGKIAALLELGAGFHSEFTGRQNIFLNASLQGLNEKEIQDRESSIIDFSELQEFIDKPIKTYSSGMIVRLAFSIATCVDPEILIIDEALSVGDYNFQQKCIRRMMNFIDRGKTVVLCSHSMYLVNKLCTKTIWLEQGKEREYGETKQVVSDYLAYQEERNSSTQVARSSADTEVDNPGSSAPEVIITEIQLTDKQNRFIDHIRQFQKLYIQVRTKQIGKLVHGHVVVQLKSEQETAFFGSLSKDHLDNAIVFEGEKTIGMVISSFPLQSGRYKFHAIITDEHALQIIHEYATDSYTVTSEHPEYGLIHFDHYWNIT